MNDHKLQEWIDKGTLTPVCYLSFDEELAFHVAVSEETQKQILKLLLKDENQYLKITNEERRND